MGQEGIFMKTFLNHFLFSDVSVAVFTALGALGALCFYSTRYGFVFVDNALFKNFALALFLLAVLGEVCLFTVFALRVHHSSLLPEKLACIMVLFGEVMAVVSLVYPLISLAVDQFMSLSSAWTLCKQALPVWGAVVSVAFFAFVFPAISSGALKKGVAVAAAVILVFISYASIFPVTPYRFTSDPVVFDNGSDYAVVFSTNVSGTGWLEYTYNGETVRLYDETDGRKNNSRIHTFRVPKDQLSGSTYRVGATRVIDELTYGGRTGKTIESEPITLQDTFGQNIDVLTLSDWHTKNARAKAAAETLGDYQALILLGDCSPGLMSQDDVVKYILQFASDLSGGTMPVIYVRGNHETRGPEADNLTTYLGMDRFYFTTTLGSYDLVVLDSCEDKEDSHPEYGGMNDYETYRRNMVSWLETLQPTQKHTVALCHAPEIAREEDLSAAAFAKLDELGVSLLASGHEHVLDYRTDGRFPVLVDGGQDANGMFTFVASMLHFAPNGIDIVSVDQDGSILLETTAAWK